MIFNKNNINELKEYFKKMTPEQAKELDDKAELQSSKDLSDK